MTTKYTDEDILWILQRAFAYEIKNHNWQCEFVGDYTEDMDDSFWEIGDYTIYKTSEGFHLTYWAYSPGSYANCHMGDVDECDISDEKDIWGVIKQILWCELELRVENTLPDIAEELDYKNDKNSVTLRIEDFPPNTIRSSIESVQREDDLPW